MIMISTDCLSASSSLPTLLSSASVSFLSNDDQHDRCRGGEKADKMRSISSELTDGRTDDKRDSDLI